MGKYGVEKMSIINGFTVIYMLPSNKFKEEFISYFVEFILKTNEVNGKRVELIIVFILQRQSRIQ